MHVLRLTRWQSLRALSVTRAQDACAEVDARAQSSRVKSDHVRSLFCGLFAKILLSDLQD